MSQNGTRSSRTKQGLALAGVATLATLTCGGFTAAAQADPPSHAAAASHGNGNGHGNGKGGNDQGDSTSGHAHGNGKGNGTGNGTKSEHGKGHDKGDHESAGNGTPGNHGSNGKGHDKGDHGKGGQGHGGSSHNPPGNNGTVKIAGPGDAPGHPSNNPHPGCTFYIEWFGYDQGADVVSTVSFAPQAPTSDVTIGGTEPSRVFVGGDAAGGGTDLDGRQAYTLSFTGGAPHPQQGYHVKVTVSTPHSQGNDTKSKVFWVGPCTDTPGGPGDNGGDTPGGPGDNGGDTPGGPGDNGGDTPGEDTPPNGGEDTTGGSDTPSTDQEVRGTVVTDNETGMSSTSATSGSAGTAPTSGSAVPTAVAAGEDSALPEWARSPLPLALVGGGLVVTAAGLARRVRTRA